MISSFVGSAAGIRKEVILGGGTGTFVWNRLVTPDQKASGAFFSELLGLTRRAIEAGPLGVDTVLQNHGQDVAGIMNPTIDYTRQRGARWSAYVAVATLTRAPGASQN